MLRNVVNPPEQLPIEDISSPLNARIFELYDAELFPEPLQNPEVSSSSNFFYEKNSSYTTNLSFAPAINKLPNTIEKNGTKNTTTTTTATATSTTAPTTTTATTINNSNLSVIFDSQEEIEADISASIGFSPSTPFSVPPFFTNQQDQFDLTSPQSQTPLVPLMGPPLPSVFQEECLSLMPYYRRLNSSSPSCSLLEPTMGSYLPGNSSTTWSADNSGIFNGSFYISNERQTQEYEHQGDNNGGIFCPEALPRIYNSSELQANSNESQHVVNEGGSSTPLAPDISSLEDSTFKVGKLSVDQRKEKIDRYLKKRTKRNFSKKIKYACRKTLADSRPRVRGRFAKNDEFSEMPRTAFSYKEEDTYEDSLQVVVKEEEDMVDSSDILAHISGVNSFKCNYPIQSWT